MDRREFLKWQLISLIFCVIGPRFSWSFPEKGSKVVAVKGEVSKALEAGLKELGGIKTFVSEDSRVVIKPNMSFRNPPEMGTTTHPEVLKALVNLLSATRPKGIKVLDNTLTDPDACLKNSGIAHALKGLPVDLKILKSKADYQEVKVQGKVLSSLDVMKDVLMSDIIISVPVAKHHSSAGVSLSMKNLMGLIYDRSSFHYKYDLHTAIADMANFLKPKLVIVDMTRALTTNGPSGPGEVAIMDTIVVSNDMVAADAYVTSKVKWYGKQIEPFKVKHIKVAHEMGIGMGDLSKVEVIEKAV